MTDKKTLTEQMEEVLRPIVRMSFPHISDPRIEIKPRQQGKTQTVTGYTSRWGDDFDPAEFQRTLQDMLDKVATPEHRHATMERPDGTRVIFVSGDYSAIEAHALATLIHESGDPVLLDLDRYGSIPGDDRRFFPMYEKTFVPKQPAVKQNGRSAAYLNHDRSKQHRRPKRGR